jgi:hypothetical protein
LCAWANAVMMTVWVDLVCFIFRYFIFIFFAIFLRKSTLPDATFDRMVRKPAFVRMGWSESTWEAAHSYPFRVRPHTYFAQRYSLFHWEIRLLLDPLWNVENFAVFPKIYKTIGFLCKKFSEKLGGFPSVSSVQPSYILVWWKLITRFL